MATHLQQFHFSSVHFFWTLTKLLYFYANLRQVKKHFLPRQSSLGLNFCLFFSFLRSVTNRRLGSTAHASLMHAYDTWNSQTLSSCKATSSDAMITRAMKSHTNEHTVRGRPTLTVVKRFRKGSVCKAYERSTICERTFWVNLSRIMLCCVMPRSYIVAINRGYRLFTLIKSI